MKKISRNIFLPIIALSLSLTLHAHEGHSHTNEDGSLIGMKKFEKTQKFDTSNIILGNFESKEIAKFLKENKNISTIKNLHIHNNESKTIKTLNTPYYAFITKAKALKETITYISFNNNNIKIPVAKVKGKNKNHHITIVKNQKNNISNIIAYFNPKSKETTVNFNIIPLSQEELNQLKNINSPK